MKLKARQTSKLPPLVVRNCTKARQTNKLPPLVLKVRKPNKTVVALVVRNGTKACQTNNLPPLVVKNGTKIKEIFKLPLLERLQIFIVLKPVN